MSLFNDIKRHLGVDSTDDEIYYLKVVKEMEGGYKRDGLWAKALAETDGDSDKAHAKYIRLRVLSLKEELNIRRSAEVANPTEKKELIPTDGKNVKPEASISTAIFAVCVLSAVGGFVIAAVTSIAYRIYLTFFEEDSWLIGRRINQTQDGFELVLFACLALVGIGVIPLATSYAYKGIKKRFEEARKNGQ
jgi:hypothetical protein